MRHLLIFEIDAVLIEPNGYWAALQETVGLYARSLGYGPEGVPSPADIEVLEAGGLASEWDAAPVCIAALLIGAAAGVEPPAPEHLLAWVADPVEHIFGAEHPAPPPPEGFFAALARRIGAARRADERPAQTAERVLLALTPPALVPAIRALLEDTHAIERAPVTQVFQHFALGHGVYEECYGLAARFSSTSLLVRHDRPLLKNVARLQLRELGAAGCGLSLYTARPSRPPRDADVDPLGYSPQAEIAADLVALENAPLIGFGRLQWLATQRGWRADDYVKPAAVHALAAIGAALDGGETAALEAAAALHEDGRLLGPLRALEHEPARVVAFEANAHGAGGVLAAVERLRAAGGRVDVTIAGVAPEGSVRAQALRPIAQVLVPDVNAGIAWLAAAVLPGQPAPR
jgi:hypothetical protein